MISINLKSQEPSGSQPSKDARLVVRSAFLGLFCLGLVLVGWLGFLLIFFRKENTFRVSKQQGKMEISHTLLNLYFRSLC